LKPAALSIGAIALWLGAGAASCGNGGKVDNGRDGGAGAGMGGGGMAGLAGMVGAGGAAGSGGSASASAPCLDQPTDLPRPPEGRLPCELIPPGLRL
jgi:hypothetical protein